MSQLQDARKNGPQQAHELTYRLGARKTLHQRSIESLAPVLAVSWVAAVFSESKRAGPFGLFRCLVSGATLINTATFFVFGMILVGLRNARVQVNPRVSPTYLHDLLSIASDPSSWVLFGFYVIMSTVMNALFFVPVGTDYENYRELVVYINEKGFTQINERYILVRAFAVLFGLTYGASHLLTQKDWLSFPVVQLGPWGVVANSYKRVLYNALTFSSIFTAIFWTIYNVFLSRFLISAAMTLVAEEILYHAPQYGPRWYSFTLAYRLFSNAFYLAFFLEGAHVVCDQLLTKRMNVSGTSMYPNECLISGLKMDGSSRSPEALLTYHAFQELNHLAAYSPARRTGIFLDANNTTTSWKQIAVQCLQVLDNATKRINKVGEAPPVASVAGIAAPSLSTSVRRRLPPGKGGAFEDNIFRPSKNDSFFDNFKGLSTEEILAQSKSEEEKKLASQGVVKSKERLEVLAFRWATKRLSELVMQNPNLQKHSGGNPSHDALRTTQDFQLIIWSFQSLARLVARSYQEDFHGVVQKDIPNILESMVALLMALETFLSTDSGSDEFASSKVVAHVNAQALVVVRSYALIQALKTSIFQITTAFEDQLSQFSLSRSCAKRLESFTNMDD